MISFPLNKAACAAMGFLLNADENRHIASPGVRAGCTVLRHVCNGESRNNMMNG